MVDGENGLDVLINKLLRVTSKLESFNDNSINVINENVNNACITIDEISKLLKHNEFCTQIQKMN